MRDKDRFRIVLFITFAVFIAELAGGFISHSLALSSDAVHMFLDGLAVLIALWCECKPKGKIDFRAVGALTNSFLLIIGAGIIAFEAARRIANPPEVTASIMLAVAIIGLIANIICALILHPKSDAHLNKKALFIHALSDGSHSFVVIVAGSVIAATGWMVIDPMLSFVLTAVMFFWGVKLLKESWRLLASGKLDTNN